MKRSNGLLLLALALITVLPACQQIGTTGTTGPEIDLSGICAEWREISFSGAGDTSQTVSEVRGNNAARKAFCEGQGE